MIPITKPFLPPKEDFDQLVAGIWERNWLTNEGPLNSRLELELKKILGQEHLLFVTNGTIALQLAIRALGLTGEVITTPFSYVATTSSLVWEGCEPVFADIDPLTLNIDPAAIEALITSRTSGILATHVFGNICDVEAIQKIADRHGLKVIYDGAHAFGVNYKGKSIFSYGDVSTCSFHATKLFHTIEGGAVMTKDPELLRKMSLSRSFGHTSATSFEGVGINGKNSEFHAAMGLANMNHIPQIIDRRKKLSELYGKWLQDFVCKPIGKQEGATYNYAYYPILLSSEKELERIITALNRSEIYPRRYFYPSLSQLDYVNNWPTPRADDIASRVLCLPLYHELLEEEVELICRLILREKRYQSNSEKLDLKMPARRSNSLSKQLISTNENMPQVMVENKSTLAERIGAALNTIGWILIPDYEPDLQGGALGEAYRALCEEVGVPIGHDRAETIIWDIKSRDAGSDGNKVITYSEHNHEADLHTDSQYSEYPEDYFGLLTLRKARCGGGESYLLSLKDLLQELSSTPAGREAIEVLQTTNYPFIVPNVFRKKVSDKPEFNFGPILREGEIRFRIDTFEKALAVNPNLCTPRQLSSFNLLKKHVRSSPSMKTFVLDDRDLIFINNKTMLHGRGSFADADRHLLRIRMNKK